MGTGVSGHLSVRELGSAEWDAALDRTSLATVYHRDAWLGALEQTLRTRIHRLVCERDGSPVCLWPVGIARKGPLRIAGSPLPGWNTAYLGPLFVGGTPDALGVLEHMIRSSPLRKPSFIALRAMDPGLDLSALGFRQTRAFETYEMDLTLGEEALWSGLKSTCRTRVRKGEKNGLKIREETDPSYLDDFWMMACDVFSKSRQRPPYSRALLEQIESRLRRAGELIVTSAYKGEDRIATLIIPHDRKAAMYFAGGTRADALSLAPNNLLHWKTMLLCMQRGIRTYDFISNRGSPGKFKKTFGPAERVSCRHWERSSNPVVRGLRDLYERRARAGRKLDTSTNREGSVPGDQK